MKAELTAHCPHCDGSGKLPLEGPLLECAQALAGLGGVATLPEIHKAAGSPGTDITTTHQRIRRLLALGAVKRVGQERPQKFELSGDCRC